MNESIAIEPKRMTGESSWLSHQQREGFTQFMSSQLKVSVPVDHELDVKVFVQRQHLLSAAHAVKGNKRTIGICHANVVGRN